MISSRPNYLHADGSDGEDLSYHQHYVTGGQLVTMSLVPSTVDSDVVLECHLSCPLLYLQRRCPPWTVGEGACASRRFPRKRLHSVTPSTMSVTIVYLRVAVCRLLEIPPLCTR